jgi:hypothetical protein
MASYGRWEPAATVQQNKIPNSEKPPLTEEFNHVYAELAKQQRAVARRVPDKPELFRTSRTYVTPRPTAYKNPLITIGEKPEAGIMAPLAVQKANLAGWENISTIFAANRAMKNNDYFTAEHILGRPITDEEKAKGSVTGVAYAEWFNQGLETFAWPGRGVVGRAWPPVPVNRFGQEPNPDPNIQYHGGGGGLPNAPANAPLWGPGGGPAAGGNIAPANGGGGPGIPPGGGGGGGDANIPLAPPLLPNGGGGNVAPRIPQPAPLNPNGNPPVGSAASLSLNQIIQSRSNLRPSAARVLPPVNPNGNPPVGSAASLSLNQIIQSRSNLRPSAARVLPPAPSTPPSLHASLMNQIRQGTPLRPNNRMTSMQSYPDQFSQEKKELDEKYENMVSERAKEKINALLNDVHTGWEDHSPLPNITFSDIVTVIPGATQRSATILSKIDRNFIYPYLKYVNDRYDHEKPTVAPRPIIAPPTSPIVKTQQDLTEEDRKFIQVMQAVFPNIPPMKLLEMFDPDNPNTDSNRRSAVEYVRSSNESPSFIQSLVRNLFPQRSPEASPQQAIQSAGNIISSIIQPNYYIPPNDFKDREEYNEDDFDEKDLSIQTSAQPISTNVADNIRNALHMTPLNPISINIIEEKMRSPIYTGDVYTGDVNQAIQQSIVNRLDNNQTQALIQANENIIDRENARIQNIIVDNGNNINEVVRAIQGDNSNIQSRPLSTAPQPMDIDLIPTAPPITPITHRGRKRSASPDTIIDHRRRSSREHKTPAALVDYDVKYSAPSRSRRSSRGSTESKTPVRRSSRNRNVPQHFNDYLMDPNSTHFNIGVHNAHSPDISREMAARRRSLKSQKTSDEDNNSEFDAGGLYRLIKAIASKKKKGNKRRRIHGGGFDPDLFKGILKQNKRGRWCVMRDNMEFGIFGIDKLKLAKNILSIVRLTTGKKVNGWPNKEISHAVNTAILQLNQGMMPDYNELDENERDLIQKLVEQSHLPTQGLKANKPVEVPIDQAKDLMLRNLGEIKSGNDSAQLRKQTQVLMNRLIKAKLLSPTTANQICHTFQLVEE